MKSGFRNSNGNGLKALPNVADLVTGQRSEARVNTDWERTLTITH